MYWTGPVLCPHTTHTHGMRSDDRFDTQPTVTVHRRKWPDRQKRQFEQRLSKWNPFADSIQTGSFTGDTISLKLPISSVKKMRERESKRWDSWTRWSYVCVCVFTLLVKVLKAKVDIKCKQEKLRLTVSARKSSSGFHVYTRRIHIAKVQFASYLFALGKHRRKAMPSRHHLS